MNLTDIDPTAFIANSAFPSGNFAFPGALAVGTSTVVSLPSNGLFVRGNVGIGTMSPAGPLQVNASDGQSIIFGANDGVNDNIRFLPDYSNGANYIQAGVDSLDTGAILRFTRMGTTLNLADFQVYADNSTFAGNVGIGTTGPSARLEIKNAGTDTVPFAIENSDNTSALSEIFVGGSGNPIFKLYKNDGTQTVQIHTAASSYFNGGNVGIGTTAPDYKLHIAETTADTFPIKVEFNASTLGTNNNWPIGLYFKNTDVTANSISAIKFSFLADSGTTTYPASDILVGKEQLWTSTAGTRDGYLAFRSVLNGNLNERMRIDSAGNVGIGTTSPGANLEVLGGVATAPGLLVKKGYPWGTGEYSDVVKIKDKDGTYTLFNIKSDGTAYFNGDGAGGNVGIGTASPGAKLEVAGQVKITGGTPAAGQVLTSDAAGLATWEPVSAGMGGSGTASYVPKFTGATTLGNSVMYEASGRIGIGTTSPDAILDVENATAATIRMTRGTFYSFLTQGGYGGEITLNDTSGVTKAFLSAGRDSYLMGGNVGIGTASPDAALDIEHATNASLRLTNTGASYSYFYQTDSGGALVLQDSAGTPKWVFLTYGGSYLASGNFGIGTTGPSSPLSVGGAGGSSYSIYSLRTDGGYAVYGTNSGTGYGVSGQSTGATGIGVLGSAAIGGTGVYAYSNGSGYALRAINSSSGYAVYCDATTANKCGGNQAWYNASDRKLKENIQPISNALYKVSNLEGVTYNLKKDPTKTPQMGFIAQDVRPYVPEVVSYDEENDYWGMQSSQLTALLVEAVKEQQEQIEELKARIEELER